MRGRARGLGVALVVALSACGGGEKRAAEPAPEPVDQRDPACRDYGQHLFRFDAALDAYERDRGAADDVARADAIRDMSEFLHTELPALRGIRVADRELQKAHRQLVASLEELSGALEQQATALALDDRQLRIRSLKRRSAAWSQWSLAFEVIVQRCGDPAQAATQSAARSGGTQTQPSS